MLLTNFTVKTGSKKHRRTYKAKWVSQKKKELKVVDKEDVVGKETGGH